MIDSILNEMQARCDKATAGPWTETRDGMCARHYELPLLEAILGGETSPPIDRPLGQRNITFVAHARTDLPRCIKALREAHSFIMLLAASKPTNDDTAYDGFLHRLEKTLRGEA